MAFYLMERKDLAVAQIPRCALNTIAAWLGYKDIEVVQNDDPRLLKMSKRVAYIRDPRDRLGSAFSMFYWNYDYTGKMHVSGAPISSWEAFVDYVLDPNIPDDEHWMPQTKIVGNIPNIYHKFENLVDTFQLYRPGILPHKNMTTRRPTTDYRKDELLIKYADDIRLYQGAS